MLAAGLLAKKAVERGLTIDPAVKTSLAPGSRVVTDYLQKTGLQTVSRSTRLQHRRLRLHHLHRQLRAAPSRRSRRRSANSISSRRRCFPAIAISRRACIKTSRRTSSCRRRWSSRSRWPAASISILPRSRSAKGGTATKFILRDLWPTLAGDSRRHAVRAHAGSFPAALPRLRRSESEVERDPVEHRRSLPVGREERLHSRAAVLRRTSRCRAGTIEEIRGARPLGIFGDSVTTDHISPAGAIKPTSPAGQYLISRGIEPEDFNSYGSRRGNDLVMTRGTFANVRIKNLMVPGTEGGVTIHSSGAARQMSIFDAAMKYQAEGVPLGHPGRDTNTAPARAAIGRQKERDCSA